MLALHDNADEYEPAAPVPESEIIAGEFEALLATLALPVTLPLAAGAKVTFNVAACPTPMICPVAIPLALKPDPEMLTLATVTLEPPELVSVTGRVLPLPTLTLLKARSDELKLKVPGAVTVSVAAALETLPAALLITTLNWAPLSTAVVAGVV